MANSMAAVGQVNSLVELEFGFGFVSFGFVSLRPRFRLALVGLKRTTLAAGQHGFMAIVLALAGLSSADETNSLEGRK